jgi:hypothetical protein
LEKGEAAIVTGQFVALALLILILGNYANIAGVTNVQVGKVYWGTPSTGVVLKSNSVNKVNASAGTISVLVTLPTHSTVATSSASRLCLSAGANSTGEYRTYNNFTIGFYSQTKQNYVSFGPTTQSTGESCVYTISVTDSLQQVATWTATVNETA